MRFYARKINDNQWETSWANREKPRVDGWYELEREPDILTECLEYNSELDIIEIKRRIETPEQLQAKQEAREKVEYIAAMPELVKSLEAEIISLKGKVEVLETAREVAK